LHRRGNTRKQDADMHVWDAAARRGMKTRCSKIGC